MDANQRRDLELIEGVRAGVPGSKEALVEKYVPLVKYIVRHYYARRMDFEDLFQEGLIGLLQAIDEYRPERFDVKFSSFAYLCVVRKIYNIIKQSNGRKHRLLSDAVSLQASLSDGGEGRTLIELYNDEAQVDPQDVVEDRMIARELGSLLRNHLSVLEYTVLGFVLQGFTCTDIEERTGINAKAVDNARTRVKLKLRRLVARYGSLLNPEVPRQVRRRRDLYIDVPIRVQG